MEHGGKVRKLGKGLSALIGTPVVVPVQPGAKQVEDKLNVSHTQDGAEAGGGGGVGEFSVGGVAFEGNPSGLTGSAAAPASLASPEAPSSGLAGPRPASPGQAGSRGQGGGDDAEFGGAVPASPYVVVDVREVVANRFQPRSEFDEGALRVLAGSIKRDGMMQPLVVRAWRGVGGASEEQRGTSEPGEFQAVRWELIAGERRWRAAQMAGLTLVPAVVVDVPDLTAAMWAVIENVQRVDLGAVEKSRAYARLSSDFGLTQAEIAEQVGEDRTAVSHYIRMGELEDSVIGLVQSGKLTFGHARVLNSPMVKAGRTREVLAARAAREALSVRQLEQLVSRGAGDDEGAAESVAWTPRLFPQHEDAPFEFIERQEIGDKVRVVEDEKRERARREEALFEKRANIREQEDRIARHLGTKVKIATAGNGKRGVITLEFYSLDHFDGVLGKMGVRRET